MRFSPSTATLPALGQAARPKEQFAHELAALVDDIQRTKDWFNSQMEAQLAQLQLLHASVMAEEKSGGSSMATLFEAPRPVLQPVPEAAAAPVVVPTQHSAIVLAPTMVMTLDPQLEQDTLNELNDALSRAFSEISSRSGMLG